MPSGYKADAERPLQEWQANQASHRQAPGRARRFAGVEQQRAETRAGDAPLSPRSKRNAKRQVGASASIRREVEVSLKRLGVERIDLYQMHWPAEDGAPLEEYWRTLLDLKKEGKVRAVGLSNHSAAQLETAEALGHVDTLQPPFSAIRRDVAKAELPWCHAHQTGVIVYSPMQSGLLTGGFSVKRAQALPKDDWRSRNEEFTGEKLTRNLAFADALVPIADRHSTSVAAVAIAWTLAWPGVTGAIVGARSPAQVDGWLDATSLDLTGQDLAGIAAAIEATSAGSGPLQPGE
ncbi:aldo/keto reductase [Mesorhizobium sp. LjNodule214]|uniref:aldo/keto reductase n=1 Tax=Mesorhizobium sp. LjNodule214 TaxID=3342252 RepID=UPI003ECEB67D